MNFSMINKITNLIEKKNNFFFINFIFLIFSILIIWCSSYFYAYLDFYINDFLFAQHAHKTNLYKKIFEIIPNAGSFIGIATWPIEPYFNFLGNLNYELSNRFDYLLYINVFRVLEIFLIFLFAFNINKKIELKDLSILILLYIILLVNFNRYDHDSYVNFPILIFCFFQIISINIKNKLIFFFLNTAGNAWSYLINPIYFFNVCFFPLLFFYFYYLYNKKYKYFFLTFIANLPFTILFVLISVGTSRFALSESFIGSELHRNFTIFNSKNFLLLSLLFFIYSIFDLKREKNFYSIFFIIFTIFSTFLGYLYMNNLDNWKLPPPYQFEYSIQYCLIITFFMILRAIEKKKILIFLLILLTIFSFRSIFFIKKYYNNKNIDKLITIDKNNNFQKSYFWTKYKKFAFEKDLVNKRVFLNLPNQSSNFNKSLYFYDSKNNKQKAHIYSISEKFNGSFWHPFFWNSKISINFGYSHILNINNFLSTYFSKEKLRRQEVPRFKLKYDVIDFFQFDYILSDLDLKIPNNKKYTKFKTYDYDQFKLYLFKKTKDTNNKKEIHKINLISSPKNYKNDIFKFNNELFVFEEEFKKIKNIKYFCNTNILHNKKKINVKISSPTDQSCLAIIPIPFSFNNIFANSSKNLNEDCKTFKVQYYFHGCIINGNRNLILIKNNQFKYPLGSLKDFNDFKITKYYEKK